MDFLIKEKEAGRIRNLGFSFHGAPGEFDELIGLHDSGKYHWDFVQIEMNFVDWNHADGRRNANASYLYEELDKRGIPIVIMEPLLGGRLANVPEAIATQMKEREPDKSIASWAFRFCGTHPRVLCTLSGMTNMDPLLDNVKTFTHFKPLTEEELDFLERMATQMMEYPTVNCTDCKYCMPCPWGIDIPGIFKHYNTSVTEGRYQEGLPRKLQPGDPDAPAGRALHPLRRMPVPLPAVHPDPAGTPADQPLHRETQAGYAVSEGAGQTARVIVEMATFLPDEGTMLRIQVGPEQFVIGADIVADARNGLVLHVFLPIAEAQINGLGHGPILFGKGDPAMNPDRRGCSGDGPEAVRPGAGPEGEKAAQGVPAQDNRPGAVSAIQLRKKVLQDIVQRFLPMLPRLRVAGDVPVRPGHQIDGPVLQFDGHKEEGTVDEGGELRHLGLQRGVLVPGRRLHENAVRSLRPEQAAGAPGDGKFYHAFREYSFATMAPLMLCQTLNRAPGMVASG